MKKIKKFFEEIYLKNKNVDHGIFGKIRITTHPVNFRDITKIPKGVIFFNPAEDERYKFFLHIVFYVPYNDYYCNCCTCVRGWLFCFS